MIQAQIEIILNYIVALDNLHIVQETVQGWLLTSEYEQYYNAARLVTDAGLRHYVGLKYTNVWD